jgi:hypothetical protein
MSTEQDHKDAVEQYERELYDSLGSLREQAASQTLSYVEGKVRSMIGEHDPFPYMIEVSPDIHKILSEHALIQRNRILIPDVLPPPEVSINYRLHYLGVGIG